jgi:tetratricopeptide (TPR) repeat protein
MRMRLPSTLAVAVVLACLAPPAAKSQTDTSLKLSTTVPQAVAEFRAGMRDWENISFEAAASHFGAATKADPGFGLARVMYGFTAASAAEITREQALSEIDRGVADAGARGNTNELLLAAAYRESFQGHPRVATEIFDAVSHLMPADRMVATNAIGAVGPGGTPSEFTQALRDFIAKNPDYPAAYNTYAYTSWGAGDHAAAIAAAKKQTELNPNAPNPHDTYGEILQWNGNFPEALAEYRRATMTPPRFPSAYSGMAEVEALQGHYDQARAYLNQAIANAWSPRQKLNNMFEIAGTYALQGSATEALIRQLDAVAAEARSQNDLAAAAIATSEKAPTYATANNAAAAHKAIADAKAILSPEPWDVNYFATMAHALMKHWGPANQELAVLKQKTTDNPGIRRTLVAAAEGNLATQQGQPADALKILMAADTTDISVMNRIAEAHAALGHSAEANRWYGRISNNFALNLADFPAVNARRRTRFATVGGKP